MDKAAFLTQLREGLTGLPREDVAERVNFYSEMIDDRMEEGLSQEEAVAQIGSVEDIIAQIRKEYPQPKKEKRRLTWAEIALLVLTAPVWLPLLVSVLAVILTVCIVVWAIVISLWAVDISLLACSVGGFVATVVFAIAGKWLAAVAILGGSLVCFGLAVLLFFGCTAAVRVIIWLTKTCVRLLFARKGA